MKYPQLVSPRAVNAISDWLVSRLEQLGVESPQIYTRLLLSLLQSSVQINDPIEFSNLETFFTNRKGGHKRFHLPSDTETLKKLNAIHCLREIVSNEQEIATIEQLVEELCEKLKVIEKQTQNLNYDESFLIETHPNIDSPSLQSQIVSKQEQRKLSNSNKSNNQHNSRHHHQQLAHIYNNSNNSSEPKRHHNNVLTTGSATTTTDIVNDIDNDPRKRYFRAFPALSKEMEDSFLFWRRNAKSLTWPVVGRSIQVVDNCNKINNNSNSSASIPSNSVSSIISSSNIGGHSISVGKSVENKLRGEGVDQKHKVSAAIRIDIPGSGCSSNIGNSDVKLQQQRQQQGAARVIASVKKKSKRRRNQALSKGKTVQTIRKLSTGTNSNPVGSSKYYHYPSHRNSSPAWDTDFKGCWEMGPDLIKEFLTRQNRSKRNRSNSDSMDHEEQYDERKVLNEMSTEYDKPTVKRYIDLSLCCDDDDHESQRHCTGEGVDYVDEDYDDTTLASISELAVDSINPKRLYQREGHLQKSVVDNVLMGYGDCDNALDEASDSVDPIDFQQFKAKFNSSVEALWKDVEPTPTINNQQAMAQTVKENSLKINTLTDNGISSAFYATTSLNALAPFKKDLWNFWSNYNQQNYNQLANKLSTTASTSSMINTRLDDSSASSGTGADIANSSDYFSMPSNLDDFDKSVGGMRRTNEVGALFGAHTPSINVFLQNSIWSTSGDCVNATGTSSTADNDESFLIKVWHSNKKLSQLDVGSGFSGEKMPTLMLDIDGSEHDFIKSKESSIMNNTNLGANLQFPPYQNLKWSEGINAGPPCNSLRPQANGTNINEMKSLNNSSSVHDENNYTNFSSATNIGGATWEAPAYGQDAQPDLKSWCASNPISLTEMYGSDVCDSIVNQSPVDKPEQNVADIAVGPTVTLPNHSANSSGFVAYARIKQCGIVQPLTKPLQTSNTLRLPKDFFRSGEEENLLTSERTHFRPIENFVDGHTFDINNALDTVDFERTASGLLHYESEDYLEYTRSDVYMADEEVSTRATNLLKYSRKAIEDKSDMFVIKFRVRRSEEIACQTEEQDFGLAAAKMEELSGSVNGGSLYHSTIKLNNVFNTFFLSRQANNETIMAAVTKAVAAAAKAAAEKHINAGHFSWLPPANLNSTARISTCTVEGNPLWVASDASVCDEVDFSKTNILNPQFNYVSSAEITDVRVEQQLAPNWCKQDVEKQCHQRQCVPQLQQNELKMKDKTSADIERTEENSLDNTSLRTLWGMCAVCNSCEYDKSMPANRLLRDELQLEADEIMNDLRYMQDLYIGESDILTETNENNVEEVEVEVDAYEKIDGKMNRETDGNSMKNAWNVGNDTVQVSMLQKVNKLIEDLLKPDKMCKLPGERMVYDKFKETELSNVWYTQEYEKSKVETLWQYGEKGNGNNNIWQNKPLFGQYGRKNTERNETLMKPMKLLKEVGDSLTGEPQYVEALNWEHENLSKIWEGATILSSPQVEGIFTKQQQHDEIVNKIIDEDLSKKEEFSEHGKKVVEEKNLKNLQNIDTVRPPSSVGSNTYKRVQNFFNNSAANSKLAANRKRRHSASQNFYQQQLEYSSCSNNNNNNDNITDLNIYKQKLNDLLNDAKEEKQQHDLTPYNTVLMGNNMEEQPMQQTIITCKYWTTATNSTQSSLDSAAAAVMLLAAATNLNNSNMITATDADTTTYDSEDVMLEENVFGNTFSCLMDKNASILKHVTMMTRPLTR